MRRLRAPRSLITSNLKALREFCPLEPSNDTTNFRFKTLRPPIVTKAESLESAGLDMRDYEKIGSDATTSEEASAHVCRKRRRLIANRTAAMGRRSEKNLSFLELHTVKNSVRYHQALQEFLQHNLVADNALVADAEFDEALVAFFQREVSLGAAARLATFCWEQCATIFRNSGNTEDTSCHAAIAVGSAAPCPGAGILT